MWAQVCSLRRLSFLGMPLSELQGVVKLAHKEALISLESLNGHRQPSSAGLA